MFTLWCKLQLSTRFFLKKPPNFLRGNLNFLKQTTSIWKMVCMIHEDMSFHCRSLLFMAENSSINLFCHWFHYEIPFKARLFPPPLLCCYGVFFSGAMQATQLFWPISESAWFQKAEGAIFSAADESTPPCLFEFDDFHSMCFCISWCQSPE